MKYTQESQDWRGPAAAEPLEGGMALNVLPCLVLMVETFEATRGLRNAA